MSPFKPFMSPVPPEPVSQEPVVAPVIPGIPVVEAPVPEEPRKTVLVSAEDAYIHERMQGQPATLEAFQSQTQVRLREGMHRMSLPDYLEAFSYDCTQGVSCKSHTWKQFEVTFADGAKLPRWEYDHTGKEFIFRWVSKVKRALDTHINNHGWSFVNARYFPQAPGHLFTANGGVEVGGDILMFLPVKRALAIRTAPGTRSREFVRSRIAPGGRPGRVLMGDPNNPHHYMPNVAAEEDDATGEAVPAAGALVEGRDF